MAHEECTLALLHLHIMYSCEEPILESGEHCVEDEAVFCEGVCQGWLHRKCAGLTRLSLGELDTQYLCTHCAMESQGKEISKLTDTIKGLSTAITTLTETIISLQATVTKQPPIVNQHLNDVTEAKTVDRSMNIVVYIIEESPPTIPRSDRTKRDLDNLLSMLCTIDSSIQNASINDLYIDWENLTQIRLDQDPFWLNFFEE